ncbi:methyltransferase domain-containing protein [Sporodiniella umbellata]|nr:methyltransferase domain-containing protein [Sporodiniella umbellata]
MSLPNRYIQLPQSHKDKSVKEYLEDLLKFFEENYWLIHLLPFNVFTHRLWENFDISWRDAITSKMEEAGDNWVFAILDLTSETSDYSIWPDSLRQYLEKARDLALPRSVSKERKTEDVSKYILGGMSDKKVHEVKWMSQLIKQVASSRGITSVIDLGAGQGYLSRALAYDHNMKVVAVDMSEVQTKGALRFDEKAKKETKDKEQIVNLKHVTEKVTAENLPQVLASVSEDDNQQWLVTGLHTCGDLSPFIFRLFTESERIGCMVNVGCCYNALTPSGFPMSQTLIEKQMTLKSTARVLSCHSPSHWLHEGEQCIKAFDNYFFRGLLQEMLVERGLSDINDPPSLGRIKQNKEFHSFVAASLKKLKLPLDTITEQEAKEHLLKAKENQYDKHFVVLWTLRGLLAPIVESIILVDRWLYLEESTQFTEHSSVQSYPLFTLAESPRNIVYVASK